MASPVITPEMVKRYDRIHSDWLLGRILELGAGNNGVQLHTKHKQRFLSEDYLGIDLYPPTTNPPYIIEGDLRDISFPRSSFDIILAFEVLEHIDFLFWAPIFENIKRWLKPNGYFVFSTPYNETARRYDCYSPHAVFGIKETTFEPYFPQLQTTINPHPFLFGKVGESKVRRLLRGVKRIVTNHPFLKYNLYGIYQKIEVRRQ